MEKCVKSIQKTNKQITKKKQTNKQKKKMGVTFNPKNFSVSHFFLTDRRYIFRNCDKSFSCGFSCSDARNATIKATEYVTFDFSFRILVLFPS